MKEGWGEITMMTYRKGRGRRRKEKRGERRSEKEEGEAELKGGHSALCFYYDPNPARIRTLRWKP